MSKPAPATSVSQNALAALVDELGPLKKKAAPWWPTIKRINEIEKALREASEEWPAAKERVIEGKHFTTILSARTMKSTVNVLKLLTRIPLKAFLAFATCTIEGLKEHVAPEIAAEVTEQSQAGYRKLNTFAKET